MNDRNDSLNLESDLSTLYREIPQPVPSADIDERVLQAAQQAATSPQQKNRRWILPVAMAAVLVLGIGLVRTMDRETPHLSEPSAVQAPQFESQSGLRSRAVATEKKTDMATTRPAANMPQPQPSLDFRENAADRLEQHRAIPESVPVPASLWEQEEIQAEAEKRNDRQQQPIRAPLDWLREIAELRRQGRNAAAEFSLEAFRRQYPDYPLPADSEQPEQP